MKSRNTSTPDNQSVGFTLIEILVSVGIGLMIAGLSLVVGMDVYRGNSLHAEKDTLIRLLQKTRSRAIHNINQSAHGIRFEPGQYVLFQGHNWEQAENIEKFPIPRRVQVSTTAAPLDIIFHPLDGRAIDAEINLSDGVRQFIISTNREGKISWELAE